MCRYHCEIIMKTVLKEFIFNGKRMIFCQYMCTEINLRNTILYQGCFNFLDLVNSEMVGPSILMEGKRFILFVQHFILVSIATLLEFGYFTQITF